MKSNIASTYFIKLLLQKGTEFRYERKGSNTVIHYDSVGVDVEMFFNNFLLGSGLGLGFGLGGLCRGFGLRLLRVVNRAVNRMMLRGQTFLPILFILRGNVNVI